MRQPTREERKKEKSFLYTNIADTTITVLLVIVAVLTGSLTMLGEAVRVILLLSVDYFTIWVLFSAHRGRLTNYEYGIGKLEQFVWVICGTGLLVGGLWVAQTIVYTVLSPEPGATPLGLVIAAIVNGINTTINAIGLYAMYHAARGDESGVFGAQIRVRQGTLAVSIVLQITLTAAALAKDSQIALALDALGAAVVVLIKLRRGLMMVARGLPHLLDAPASDALNKLIRYAVATVIPDEHVVSVRTRRSGEMTHAEVVVGDRAFANVEALEASSRRIREAMGAEGAAVDLSVVVVPVGEIVATTGDADSATNSPATG